MPQSWEAYVRGEELAALGAMLTTLERHLRERSEGRNHDCWPVYSSGGKDADLTTQGCAGIKRISFEGCDDEIEVALHCGIHATIGRFEEDEMADACLVDACAGCRLSVADTDHEEITLAASFTLKVPWARCAADDSEDWGTTAERCIAAFDAAVRPYEESLVALHKTIDAIQQTIDENTEE